MLYTERHHQILRYLETHSSVTVQELSKSLYASPSTIRRDLSELESMGFLQRVHGGAVLTTGSNFDTPASIRRSCLALSVQFKQLFLRFQLDRLLSRPKAARLS